MHIKAPRLFGIKDYSAHKLRGPAFLLDTKTLGARGALMPNEFLGPSRAQFLNFRYSTF